MVAAYTYTQTVKLDTILSQIESQLILIRKLLNTPMSGKEDIQAEIETSVKLVAHLRELSI